MTNVRVQLTALALLSVLLAGVPGASASTFSPSYTKQLFHADCSLESCGYDDNDGWTEDNGMLLGGSRDCGVGCEEESHLDLIVQPTWAMQNYSLVLTVKAASDDDVILRVYLWENGTIWSFDLVKGATMKLQRGANTYATAPALSLNDWTTLRIHVDRVNGLWQVVNEAGLALLSANVTVGPTTKVSVYAGDSGSGSSNLNDDIRLQTSGSSTGLFSHRDPRPTIGPLAFDPDIVNATDNVTVTTTITHPDGVANATFVCLFNGVEHRYAMTNTGGANYTATIPAQPKGTKVECWVEANSTNSDGTKTDRGYSDEKGTYTSGSGQPVVMKPNNHRPSQNGGVAGDTTRTGGSWNITLGQYLAAVVLVGLLGFVAWLVAKPALTLLVASGATLVLEGLVYLATFTQLFQSIIATFWAIVDWFAAIHWGIYVGVLGAVAAAAIGFTIWRNKQ